MTMEKFEHRWQIVFVILLLAIFSTWTVKARANNSTSANLADQEEIKEIIDDYFEIRYRTHNTLQLKEFQTFIGEVSQPGSLLHSEEDKLEIELHHAKLNYLRYLMYEYFLDYEEILIDDASETATISVFEGHDVIFEISQMISKNKPVISSMRNLQHIIVMHKEDGSWKMVSDEYDDYLWRFLEITELSKDDYLSSTIDSQLIDPTDVEYLSPTYNCNLQEDDSTYPYNREGAVDYAHEWAFGRNPDYFDFSDPVLYGGDCTNFISQAIYEGGGAIMAYSNNSGIGEVGWYYRSDSDYAKAWTHVEYFFEIVTYPGYLYWPAGPEGCKLDDGLALYQAREGDVIQYDWDSDNIWDHGVIIVQSVIGPPDWNHYVASHSPDHDNYPYTYFVYQYPNMVYRFIRIERLDGNRVHLALILNNGTATQMQNPLIDPYPAPVDFFSSITPSPYPPPSDSTEQSSDPYPAP